MMRESLIVSISRMIINTNDENKLRCIYYFVLHVLK